MRWAIYWTIFRFGRLFVAALAPPLAFSARIVFAFSRIVALNLFDWTIAGPRCRGACPPFGIITRAGSVAIAGTQTGGDCR